MEDSLSRGHSAGQALEARLPDEITMCKFRHQLKAHEMGTRKPQLIQQQHKAGQSLRPGHEVAYRYGPSDWALASSGHYPNQVHESQLAFLPPHGAEINVWA